MHTFEFIRPEELRGGGHDCRADENRATGRGRAVPRRRNDAARPDEAERRNPRAAHRHQPAAARQGRADARWRAEDRRHRQELGSSPPPDGTAGLRRAVTGDPRRRIGTAPQHGDDRRQPAPADAVHVLPRHRDAVQQARAGNGLSRDHRQQPHARGPGHERTLHRDQPVGHVRGDGRAGGDGARAGSEGLTRRPDRRLSSPARPHTATRDGARTGRPDHARHAPAAHRGEQAGVSEAARPGVVRVRPGVGSRCDHGRGRESDAGTRCAGWRGHQAVAISEAEAALVGQTANATSFRNAAEAAMRDAKPQSENAFKIELAKRCLTHALQTAATS